MTTNWDYAYVPESIYYPMPTPTSGKFYPTVLNPNSPNSSFETGNIEVPVFPHFILCTTNHLQAIILDGENVIDYVQLSGPNGSRDVSEELRDKTSTDGTSMWSTNASGYSGPNGTPTEGVVNQIKVSRAGSKNLTANSWIRPPNLPAAFSSSIDAESGFFNAFFDGTFTKLEDKVTYSNDQLVVQAPYTPTRTIWDYVEWQANDPLVHYLASDLLSQNPNSGLHRSDQLPVADYPQPPINTLGATSRYQPWGRSGQLSSSPFQAGGGYHYDADAYNLSYRDSLVSGSDFWDFPTHKYPNVGWIGRVHRGTPWQTVFLKATNLLSLTQTDKFDKAHTTGVNTWNVWTGNQFVYDNLHSAPVNDRFLFELFTAAPNDNAQRGTLSVNQIQLASLSALLSGVVVMTNITDSVIGDLPSETTTPVLTNMIVSPAGFDVNGSAYDQILFSIANLLGDTNAFPAGVFTHVGDILRVPALTEQSPFINFGGGNDVYQKYDISDELYEWLPQQLMGLVRLGAPRYVVYCYGQALKPAQDGRVLGGSFSQLVTNYQVVAESAIRVVLRVDNPTGTNGSPRVVIESSRPLAPE